MKTKQSTLFRIKKNLLTIFLLLFVPTFCSTFDPTLANAAPFKVGITLPLTGAIAEFGAAVKNGIELAREDNPALTQNIKFIFEDDGYEPRRALTSLEKMTGQDGINLFFSWGTETALATAPVAEAKKFPMLAGSLDPRTSLKREWVFGIYAPYKAYSNKLVSEFVKKNVRQIVIVKSELSFFNGLISGIEEFKPPNMTLEVVDSFTPTELDFRTTITRLKTKKFDRLGLYLTNPQTLSFLKQAEEQHLTAKYFGPTQLYDRKLIAVYGKALTGAELTHNFCNPEFHKRYFERFGSDSHIAYAANVYEISRLIGELFGDGRTYTKEEVRQKLIDNTGIRNSVAGDYSLATHPEGGRYFNFPAAVYEIRSDGEFALVQ